MKETSQNRSIAFGIRNHPFAAAAIGTAVRGRMSRRTRSYGSDGSGGMAVAQADGSIVRDRIGMKTMPVEIGKSLESNEA